MERLLMLVGVGLLASLAGFATFFILRRRSIERRSRATAARSRALEAHIPQSLHPVIDPDICIGSLSCITACPEGDILGIVDGAAKLVIGSNCIGHGRCALECPVGAIKLVFGSAERGVDLPHVDDNFETSRKGIHIIGELAGMGLIKNAMRQGLGVAKHLRGVMLPGGEGAPTIDVAIVGAGPAGLATALGCIDAGLSYRLFEQGDMGGAMAQYPRQKIVMSERLTLPLWGKFGASEISKEDLLATWKKIIAKTRMAIEEGCRVIGITGDDGRFSIATSKGIVAARKVVLAIGRRGTPRRLGVAGEDSTRVTYSLLEPEQYAGQRVLVVGGGDSALEAALALAEQDGCKVLLSYRGKAFAKVREQNRQRIEQAATEKRVQIALESEVASIDPGSVALQTPDGVKHAKNDIIIACLGGELPLKWLQELGIGLERHQGDKERKNPALVGKDSAEASRLGWFLTTLGLAIVSALMLYGWRYYMLPREARLASPMHESFRPAGFVGHGIGIIATLFMMSNFLYPMRKRLGFFKGSAPIRSWLTVHVFVGLMSPAVIIFHAALQSKNTLATATFGSLLIVVITGAIGRYVYGLLPASGGKAEALDLLRGKMQRQQSALAGVGSMEKLGPLAKLLEPFDRGDARQGSLIVELFALPFQRLSLRLALGRLKRAIDAAKYEEISAVVRELAQLRVQISFYAKLRRLMSVWRVLHVVLAVFLVGIIVVHVGVSIYLGYSWIFS